MAAALPEETQAHKHFFKQIATLLATFHTHHREHFAEIRKLLSTPKHKGSGSHTSIGSAATRACGPDVTQSQAEVSLRRRSATCGSHTATAGRMQGVSYNMNADAFRHFYDYHFAENRRIWDKYVTQLSHEQFTQPGTTHMARFVTRSFTS